MQMDQWQQLIPKPCFTTYSYTAKQIATVSARLRRNVSSLLAMRGELIGRIMAESGTGFSSASFYELTWSLILCKIRMRDKFTI